jgi:hypothetical protein
VSGLVSRLAFLSGSMTVSGQSCIGRLYGVILSSLVVTRGDGAGEESRAMETGDRVEIENRGLILWVVFLSSCKYV